MKDKAVKKDPFGSFLNNEVSGGECALYTMN